MRNGSQGISNSAQSVGIKLKAALLKPYWREHVMIGKDSFRAHFLEQIVAQHVEN